MGNPDKRVEPDTTAEERPMLQGWRASEAGALFPASEQQRSQAGCQGVLVS
jgi:hypothetical protein